MKRSLSMTVRTVDQDPDIKNIQIKGIRARIIKKTKNVSILVKNDLILRGSTRSL